MEIPFDDRALYTLCRRSSYGDLKIKEHDSEDMEYMLRKLNEEYYKWGLIINLNKPEYLYIDGVGQDIKLEDGNSVKTCSEFVYLGTTINNTGRYDGTINRRINNTRKSIGTFNSRL